MNIKLFYHLVLDKVYLEILKTLSLRSLLYLVLMWLLPRHKAWIGRNHNNFSSKNIKRTRISPTFIIPILGVKNAIFIFLVVCSFSSFILYFLQKIWTVSFLFKMFCAINSFVSFSSSFFTSFSQEIQLIISFL